MSGWIFGKSEMSPEPTVDVQLAIFDAGMIGQKERFCHDVKHLAMLGHDHREALSMCKYSAMSAKVTVVLVPGAWHGAWCFERVIAALSSRGIAAVAIDRPGHGNSTSPRSDLFGDAECVRFAIDAIDGDVVLVGHSYGGCVISVAGHDHPAVRHLVYLTAFVPMETESAMDLVLSTPGELSGEDVLVVDDTFTAVVNERFVGPVFYGDCSAEDQSEAAAQLQPQNMISLTQAPGVAAWASTPSTFVVCTLDKAIVPELQHRMAERTTHTVEIEASHSPFWSQPDAVADVLANVVNSL